MSVERLLSDLNESESVKESGKNFDDVRIKTIRKELNKLKNKFSRPKIKEIRRNLYEAENKKVVPLKKYKSLKEIIYKLNMYYDFDDTEYKGIRDLGNLFDLSIDEDYYKTIRTDSAFNSDYIEYECKGDKDKIL